jgi:hypothetical protein
MSGERGERRSSSHRHPPGAAFVVEGRKIDGFTCSFLRILLAVKGTPAMPSTSRAELAELYQRGDRAIDEAQKLHEDYCFIVSRLYTRPAPNARRDLLLHENRNDVQHSASLSNDTIGGAARPPSGGRDREIKLAAFARETLARWLAEINPVHSA